MILKILQSVQKHTERQCGIKVKNFFITGADRGLGLSLCKLLLESGEKVFAGQYMEDWDELTVLKKIYEDTLYLIPLDISDIESVKKARELTEKQTDHVDVLINCAGIDGQLKDIREGFDYERMLNVLNVNSLGPIRVIEQFLSLLEKGDRRIWCVSSEAGSIGECWRKNEEEYCMSKAALNMAVKILDNLLSEQGYEFRLYHPGWMNTYMTGTKETKADLDPDYAAKILLQNLKERKTGQLQLEAYDGKIWKW